MAQQDSYKLPKGWICTPLTEAIDKIVGGGTPSKAIASYFEGEIPWMTVKDMNKFRLIDTVDHISQEGVDNSSTNVIPAGTPIVATRMSLGKIVRANFDSAINQDLKAIFLNNEINDFYFEFWYRSMAPVIESMGTGTTVKGIKLTQLHSLDFMLPPRAEQKRIVEKLDSLLAQVDIIQKRLENLPNIIKRFRQSVLAAAVSGKLTEQWRKDNECQKSTVEIKKDIRSYRYEVWIEDQEAKFLAKRKVPKNDKWKDKYKEILTELSGEEKELPRGWVYETLEGLIYISARIGWKGLKADEYTEEGPLFLSVHGLNHGQYVDLSRAYHISKDRYEESPEIQLRNEDILVCKDGAGIGKIAIIKGLTELASINSSLLLIRSGKYFLTDYLYYFLAGPEIQRIVQERMTGSAVPHLFQRDVKEFILEVPPIDEQTEIVRLVEQYFALADTLEKNLSNAKQRVDNLTQSILAKAFKGELVPQDKNDEPADKLLERIKAAREQAEALEKAAKKAAKVKPKSKAKAKSKVNAKVKGVT
jgi:type I restriction enzyme S subunit